MVSIKMNAKGLLIFFLLGLAACSNTENRSNPEGILSEEKFTAVLIDFALAESAANSNVLGVITTKTDSTYAFSPLAEHQVRQSQYDSTVAYYVRNPELYKRVYENVLAGITQMQTARDTLKTKEPVVKADSLNKKNTVKKDNKPKKNSLTKKETKAKKEPKRKRKSFDVTPPVKSKQATKSPGSK